MTFEWTTWGPPLAVLAVGLVVGVYLALRTRPSEAEKQIVEAEGRRTDLEKTKEVTLEALHALELEKDKLSPEEYAQQKRALLEEGASALKELDQAEVADPVATRRERLEAQRDELGDEAVDAALAALEGRQERPTTSSGVSPAWQGAGWALLGVVLIGGLVWFAGENASTRAPGGSMTGNQSIGTSEGGGGGTAPAGMMGAGGEDPHLAMYQDRLEENPEDLEALNALTESALARRDLQTALAMNSKALEVAPEDPDALAHMAFLRMAIGQSDQAMSMLDELLEADPDFTKALVYKGLFAMAMEQPEVAIPALEQALAGEAAGNAALERELERARAMAAGEEPPPPVMPSGASAGGPAPMSGGPAPSGPAPAAGGGDVLVAGTIDLAESAADAAGDGLIFVSVRDPAGGPPLAAIRVPSSGFPVPFEVKSSDVISMGGATRPVPDAFVVSARIDSDGNAMTRSPDDPSFSAEGVEKGTTGLEATLR